MVSRTSVDASWMKVLADAVLNPETSLREDLCSLIMSFRGYRVRKVGCGYEWDLLVSGDK